MNDECSGFPFLLLFSILPYLSLSIFYAIRNKITVYFTWICTLLHARTHALQGIYKSMYFMGNLRYFSRVILTICDSGFTCCL
jgi:hypothetical protein